MTFMQALDEARDTWQKKHGRCSMCASGDVPVCGIHRGKHKCGNTPNLCCSHLAIGSQCSICHRIRYE